MKLISPLLVLLLLVSCADVLMAEQPNVQIQIVTSKDKIINIITSDEGFKNLVEY